jgi:hypothetical protein
VPGFNLCSGSTGDAATQPAGVVGGSLLANFVVGLVLPRDAATPASMTLWPGFPDTDDQLALNGLAAPRFDLRGNASAARGG